MQVNRGRASPLRIDSAEEVSAAKGVALGFTQPRPPPLSIVPSGNPSSPTSSRTIWILHASKTRRLQPNSSWPTSAVLFGACPSQIALRVPLSICRTHQWLPAGITQGPGQLPGTWLHRLGIGNGPAKQTARLLPGFPDAEIVTKTPDIQEEYLQLHLAFEYSFRSYDDNVSRWSRSQCLKNQSNQQTIAIS